MPMKFRCTACTARLHVPTRWAGTTIECPKCTTRVVVPLDPPARETVRFEDRSVEKQIEAFEAATLAVMNAAATSGSASSTGNTQAPSMGPDEISDSIRASGRHGRGMIAVPTGWLAILATAVVFAIVAAAAAGFWAGWLVSQSLAK